MDKIPYEVYCELIATLAIYACDCEKREQCGIEYKSHSYCGRAAREIIDKYEGGAHERSDDVQQG